MALILNFDTATPVCSVALASGGHILSYRESREGKNHSSLLTVFIEEVLKEAAKDPTELEAVCVSIGPGSYTGLRIGVSSAKGIAYALSIPMITIPTLTMMAAGYLEEHPETGQDVLLCPMIDARRMEVYSAFFSSELSVIREIQADILSADSYSDILQKYKVLFFGDGAYKAKNLFSEPGIRIDTEYVLSARHLNPLSQKAFKNQDFADTAYVEPFYLKDFVATIPKNKVF